MDKSRALKKFIYEIVLRKTIQGGLLLSLPFIIIGSVALTVISVPIASYQDFIRTAADGQIYYILHALRTYTLTIIPLILTFTMSFSFGKAVCDDSKTIFYYPLVTFAAYLIFFAPFGQNLSFLDVFGPNQAFVSILVTIFSCGIFHFFHTWEFLNKKNRVQTPDTIFTAIYRIILPTVAVLIFFALGHLIFNTSLYDIASDIHLKLFEHLGNGFASMFCYVFLEQFYWFFGIHGSNVMGSISNNLLLARTAENMTALAAGLSAPEIYSRAFLDSFINIGGSGSVLSLVLAIFFFAKLPHTRRIAKVSLLPCMLNISEIIVIGLPIICNGIFLIPFLLAPLAFLAVSAFAMYIEIVPVAVYPVEWTTPVLLSGYLSTGSISGSILQICTLILGVFIYKPFVLKYEIAEKKKLQETFSCIVQAVEACEKTGDTPWLLKDNDYSDVAKLLSYDLYQALQQKELHLYYQPQVNYDGTIYGGEALLRWKHPQLGFVYPPLIIFLANENKFLDELGFYLIERAYHDLEYLSKNLQYPLKLSVNVSPQQLHNQIFCGEVRKLIDKYKRNNEFVMAFELTEQIALSTTIDIMDRLRELKRMGILLSMDDFGMGHSSVMYLQDSEFDIVKLDGNLTRKVLTSNRSVDIIRAITQLADKFNFKVVAEYVENEAQRDKLASLGCHIYQGWLYSPAVTLHEFINYLQKSNKQSAKSAAAELTEKESFLVK